MSQYINENEFDTNLRLGDIIIGFSHITPIFNDFINDGTVFTLDIKAQNFFAVLTPCCSIDNKVITLAPLKQVRYKFFENSFYREDLTRINRPMPEEKGYPEKVWQGFSEEKKQAISRNPDGYSFFELFIYSEVDKLPDYILKYKGTEGFSTRYYMIDFKETFTIQSSKIVRGATYPKHLQLSIRARDELRNKLAYYYQRVPDEDKVIL